MLAAAALGALGAQLAEIRAVKADWFVGAGRVDQEDVSLEADGAVTVRRRAFYALATAKKGALCALNALGSLAGTGFTCWHWTHWEPNHQVMRSVYFPSEYHLAKAEGAVSLSRGDLSISMMHAYLAPA